MKNDDSSQSLAFLARLEAIIAERAAAAAPATSYTATLLDQGTRRIAQKVGEEGVELALAAVAEGRDKVLEEAADLVFHLLVLLRDQGATLADVTEVLEARHR